MSTNDPNDLSSFSMLDLFRLEAETQRASLTDGLLALERNPKDAAGTEMLMRAAHSLKGAARIVNLDAAVRVAHVMEDAFVAAQNGKLFLGRNRIDLMLKGVDLLNRISQTPEKEIGQWTDSKEIADFVTALEHSVNEPDAALDKESETKASEDKSGDESDALPTESLPEARKEQADNQQRFLRVTPENLNRLLGLAGESLVESRRLGTFSTSLLRLKRQLTSLAATLDSVNQTITTEGGNATIGGSLVEAHKQAMDARQFLADRLLELDMFDRRSANLSHRLYTEAVAVRMRPFGDSTRALPRMVRDLAHSLGKEARLVISGEITPVDRDVLEKLEAPLTHLLRNAVDHGLEPAAQRRAVGKPAEGTIKLEAHHVAGNLLITVSDDGSGIPKERLRSAIVNRKLTTTEVAEKMSESELLEFLFLPGFTMRDTVTEISGRGVGLDVVQNMVKKVRGTIRITNRPGAGVTFHLQLPLTLSVLRTLLAQIGGEPYAFPLAHVKRTMKLSRDKIESTEGRQHFNFEGQRASLIGGEQIFSGIGSTSSADELSIIIIGGRSDIFGIVVEKFLGERELVVQPLDPRLGKIKDISAASLMEDGSPVLIVDVEDLLRSIEKMIDTGSLSKVRSEGSASEKQRRKRILVVDDSLTVRELERKLLESRGYEVEVAIDGMDGWNAVRTGAFNLIVSDVDMPRMNGIELVTLIKKDPNLKNLPVMIVSYKDREEDRQRGLEAGADHYLTKGSFHDETLVQSVIDLIGEAE